MSSAASGHNVPVVDVSPLIHDSSSSSSSFSPTLRPCCDALLHALEEFGFVYVTGVPSVIAASDALIAPSQHFLTKQSRPYKEQISMKIRSREWRGWFGVGDELTNGVADLKEGLYFGVEHDATCEQIKKGLPMHGQNKLPPEHDYPNMRKALATYFTEAEALGAAILRGVAIALGLDETHFTPLFEPTPFSLLRVFHYPAELQEEQAAGSRWGVAEHTDLWDAHSASSRRRRRFGGEAPCDRHVDRCAAYQGHARCECRRRLAGCHRWTVHQHATPREKCERHVQDFDAILLRPVVRSATSAASATCGKQHHRFRRKHLREASRGKCRRFNHVARLHHRENVKGFPSPCRGA